MKWSPSSVEPGSCRCRRRRRRPCLIVRAGPDIVQVGLIRLLRGGPDEVAGQVGRRPVHGRHGHVIGRGEVLFVLVTDEQRAAGERGAGEHAEDDEHRSGARRRHSGFRTKIQPNSPTATTRPLGRPNTDQDRHLGRIRSARRSSRRRCGGGSGCRHRPRRGRSRSGPTYGSGSPPSSVCSTVQPVCLRGSRWWPRRLRPQRLRRARHPKPHRPTRKFSRKTDP